MKTLINIDALAQELGWEAIVGKMNNYYNLQESDLIEYHDEAGNPMLKDFVAEIYAKEVEQFTDIILKHKV